MHRRKKIEERIYEMLPGLPANQKNVAEFFLNNLHMVALLPIRDVARQASVSEASIVRFAQSLGYSGFKELKDELSSTLKDHISPTERYQLALSGKKTPPDCLHLTAQNVVSNINDTINSIDAGAFSHVVDHIIQARQIHCVGLEISYHFANLFTFLLRLYAYDAHTLSPVYQQFKEQIAYLSPEDLVLAFSFSPYSRETVEAVAFARERGIGTVAFTDKKVAPIREYTDHCIQIKTDNIMFTNSLGAVSVIINAIITELNFRDRERTLKALKIIEENIRDERYFIT
jgi:DNA-binding MurR/RpiR family transcriptional regulator